MAEVVADLPFQFMPSEITNSLGMRMVHVTAGVFDGYVSQFEVTIGQYAALMGAAPCRESSQCLCKADDCPVVLVSWNSVQGFCDKLGNAPGEQALLQANNLAGARYELPTRADWRCFAPPVTDRGQLGGAVLTDNTSKPDRPAGINNARPPNEMGLCDVYGNVAEWCADGAARGTIGGCYSDIKKVNNDYWEDSKDAEDGKDYLEKGSPDIGFRVVLRIVRSQ
jgi:formylglycine-generating enzyme required for sulfatase activity